MVGIRPELYQQIKSVAAQKHLSIRKYLEKVLEEIVFCDTSTSQEQGRPMTHETFEELRQLRERIKQDHPGQTMVAHIVKTPKSAQIRATLLLFNNTEFFKMD